MTESPRNYEQALDWFQAESQKPFGQAATPSKNWGGYCLMDVRMSYAIPAMFSSAYAAWVGADEEGKHANLDPDEAPIGSAMIWKGGSKGYGHITLASFPFDNGTTANWSNDLKQYGMLDKVARSATTEQWGQVYLGYLTELNGYDLRIKEKKPPKPKQDKAYDRINVAVQKLEGARDTARDLKDWKDAKALTIEIKRLKKMYDQLKHA